MIFILYIYIYIYIYIYYEIIFFYIKKREKLKDNVNKFQSQLSGYKIHLL